MCRQAAYKITDERNVEMKMKGEKTLTLLSYHTVVWGILSLLVFVFVCLFVLLRISQRRKKLGA